MIGTDDTWTLEARLTITTLWREMLRIETIYPDRSFLVADDGEAMSFGQLAESFDDAERAYEAGLERLAGGLRQGRPLEQYVDLVTALSVLYALVSGEDEEIQWGSSLVE